MAEFPADGPGRAGLGQVPGGASGAAELASRSGGAVSLSMPAEASGEETAACLAYAEGR